MGQRVIMCLDMDAFFASVECALDPKLPGKPVVVGGRPGGRGVVISASYEARAYGVHAGMPSAQAYRLCPQAVFLPRNFDRYREASREVQAILNRFSPWVEMASIDEAFIDLSDVERPWGTPSQVAHQIKKIIRQELNLPCSIGLAPSKVVAKVACARSKPNGLLQIHPGQEAVFLAPLAVTALPGVGPRTAARLSELRIFTCGHLATAPLLLLERLLGKHAASLQRRARGIDRTPVRTQVRVAQSINRSTTFTQDTRDPTFLRATLYRLVERVGHTLRRRDLHSACLTVQVRWADFTTYSHQCTLSHPTANDTVIYQAADKLLDYLLSKRRQRVRLLGVRASHLSPQRHQLSLFLPQREKEQRDLRLSRCLDDIRECHGFRSIQWGLVFLLFNRLGEASFGERPFAEKPEAGERAFQTP